MYLSLFSLSFLNYTLRYSIARAMQLKYITLYIECHLKSRQYLDIPNASFQVKRWTI